MRFEFAFAPSYLRLSRAFRVNPRNAWVDVDDESFDAHFGLWRVRTPRSNIRAAEITGPYAFWKTAGPARYAITDRGLTFATNGDRGVLVLFKDPVAGVRRGPGWHPELTVTVADVEGLAELLRG